jgi:hypothetical protein
MLDWVVQVCSRRKGNRENIPAITALNGGHITDSIEKAKSLSFYYSSVFSSERNIPQIQCTNVDRSFAVRNRLAATGKNKSKKLDKDSGEILKLGSETMIPYLARLTEWRNLRNEELNNSYSSPNVFRVIKSRRMR